MNFIKRALTSVTRKKSKSIILLVLVFVLGNIIMGAISVQQAVNNAERSIRQKIGGIVSTEIDFMNLPTMYDGRIDMDRFTPISSEDINRIGQLPYVRYYDYTTRAVLEGDGITIYSIEDTSMWFTMEEDRRIHQSQFFITGVHYFGIMHFVEGNGTLVEGRTFREEDLRK